MNKIARNADIIAIPCFFVLFIYFAQKHDKTKLELFLMLFALCGFVLDSIFVYNYMQTKTNLNTS